jgi:release factor glutamine methyltransferase
VTGTTIGTLLGPAVERLRASGSETARLDAELILGHVLGIDRTGVIAHAEALVGEAAAELFEADLARRERGEPVAYIRGLKEFMGLAFAVDERALIPRPETERLVELAEAEVMARLAGRPRAAAVPPLRIVDIGTGSGAIAISLAVRLRRRGAGGEVAVLATDRSADALEVARENAVGQAVGDVLRFAEADLVAPFERPFELVLANLPYVPSGAVPDLPVAASFEPRLALDGGPDGLDLVRRLVGRLPEILTEDGVAMLEIGSDQAEATIAAVAESLPGWSCTIAADLSGAPRVAVVQRANAGPSG